MTDAQSLFNSSLEAIRSSLSDADRANFRKFATPKEMIAQMRLSTLRHNDKSRLLLCCRRIAAFSRAFEPYFDIVGLFVQINPEWAGSLWGLIRIIFLLGSNLSRLFENISQFFEDMAFTLPQYQAWFDVCKGVVVLSDKDRLAQSMSLIYADIIEFCLRLYSILSRASPGSNFFRRTVSFGNLLTGPFHSRFSDLLERLQKHQAWFERETSIQQHELMARHHATFLDYLKQTENERIGQRDQRAQQYEDIKAETKISQIREWLASPAYRVLYERIKRDIIKGSGDWLLGEKRYLDWRDAAFKEKCLEHGQGSLTEDEWINRTLFIQAKPGYGKSYLSCIIIEDLLEYADTLALQGMKTPAVAFFHFSANDRWSSRDSIAGLKSIAYQLLEQHRRNEATIDALAIFMQNIAVDRREASMDDLITMIRMLLRQHPTFLLVDGIDECSDAVLFLGILRDLSQANDCRALLLSRPTVSFSMISTTLNITQIEKCIFELPRTLNFRDIKIFLEQQISGMVSNLLFGPRQCLDIDKVSSELAGCANGIFLWARLVVNYLSSAAVTPLDRLEVIEHPSDFEGLDQLYDRILNILQTWNEKDRSVANLIFQLVSCSILPLGVRAFHTALAIIPGRKTDELQYLLNFPRCVPRITCALVEVIDDEAMSFIHLSFKEYLERKEGVFSLRDKATIDIQIGTRCLSFLVHDVPAKPLQALRSSDLSSHQLQLAKLNNMRKLQDKYPFLRYAVLCWYAHIKRAHTSGNDTSEECSESRHQGITRPSHLLDQWVPHCSAFLVRRRTVTMWVEACSMFGLVPRLDRLARALSYLDDSALPDTAAGREILWVSHGVHQLSGALDTLHQGHSGRLLTNPTLIWQEYITTAVDTDFWPNWTPASRVVPVNPTQRQGDTDASFQPDYRIIIQDRNLAAT